MDDARIDPLDIDVSHVGNFVGELFCGQGHLGAMLAAVEPALAGKPASRHEAACASGSMALLSAMAELEAGRYDIALVAIGLHYRNGGDQRGGRNGCGHSLREGLSRVVELALAPTPADRSKPSKPARG